MLHAGKASRVAIIAGVALTATATLSAAPPQLGRTFKNVIVMIPDGCGISHLTIARWYKGEPLAVDALHVAHVRTYGSNSLITDSAPAATAYGSGYKTHDKYIGVLPSSYTLDVPIGLRDGFTLPANWENRPVASVLETARLKGMATGVVSTSATTHATPAGYTSHWYTRSNDAILMEQQVYQWMEVVFGGGARYIDAATRPDGESLRDTLLARGYRMVGNKTELAAVPDTTSKVWGHFASVHMAPDYDRALPQFSDEPSLAEMTAKAIAVLSSNAKGSANGFFLMVEGSQVDWGSHANDPVYVMSDYLAFDAAVATALDFARSSNTLVLVLSDHDNGGMSLGNSSTNGTYSSLPMSALLTVLKRATLTGVGIAHQLGSTPSAATIRSVMEQYYGINDLTQAEVDSIAAHANPDDMPYVVGPMLSRRSAIGWTTTGHTGHDVPLYYYGSDVHLNTIENTDIAALCAQAMNVDLARVNDSLFADAAELFAGAALTIDTAGVNSARGALTVVQSGRTGVFPFNKSEALIDGVKHPMNGLTVYSYKNGKVYVPKIARDLMAGVVQQAPQGMLKLASRTVAVEVFSLSGRKVRALKAREGALNLRALGLPEGGYLMTVNGRPAREVTIAPGGSFLVRAR